MASFHQRRLSALNKLAEIVTDGTASPEIIRRQLVVAKEVIPDFETIFVGDASGKVVMSSGSADMDELDKVDFSGEAWFKELKVSRRSSVSNLRAR